MTSEYADAVETKVEAAAERIRRGEQVDGWSLGQERICQEMADEMADCSGWARGLEQYDLPPRAAEIIDLITGDCALIWDQIMELKRIYEQPRPPGLLR